MNIDVSNWDAESEFWHVRLKSNLIWVLLNQTAFFGGKERDSRIVWGSGWTKTESEWKTVKNGDCSFHSLSELGNIYSVKEEQKNNTRIFFGFGFEMFSTGPLRDWGE